MPNQERQAAAEPSPPSLSSARAAEEGSSEDSQALVSPATSGADLAGRVDKLANWATTARDEIKGLVCGLGIVNHKLELLPELQHQVEALAQALADVGANDPGPQQPACDEVMGYRPTPEQQMALFAALATWQQGAENVDRAARASFQTRSGGSAGYSYADIGAVSSLARTAGKEGLSHFHRQLGIGRSTVLRTYLVHREGGFIYADVAVNAADNGMRSAMQNWAAAVTYARRYGMFLVMGIAAAEEDDDAAPAPPRATSGAPSGGTRPPGNAPAATRSSAPTRRSAPAAEPPSGAPGGAPPAAPGWK